MKKVMVVVATALAFSCAFVSVVSAQETRCQNGSQGAWAQSMAVVYGLGGTSAAVASERLSGRGIEPPEPGWQLDACVDQVLAHLQADLAEASAEGRIVVGGTGEGPRPGTGDGGVSPFEPKAN